MSFFKFVLEKEIKFSFTEKIPFIKKNHTYKIGLIIYVEYDSIRIPVGLVRMKRIRHVIDVYTTAYARSARHLIVNGAIKCIYIVANIFYCFKIFLLKLLKVGDVNKSLRQIFFLQNRTKLKFSILIGAIL